MGSQTDLDQGGTFRQYTRRWLGPSVGWQFVPVENVLAVVAGGTISVAPGVTLITLNVDADVTLQLFSSLASQTATAGALPGPSFATPLTIVDIGGFAATRTYQIVPFSSQLILGLASIQLSTGYGSFQLIPLLTPPGGWSQA